MKLYAVLVSYTGPGWYTLQRVILVPSTLAPAPSSSEVETALSASLGAQVSGATVLNVWRLDDER